MPREATPYDELVASGARHPKDHPVGCFCVDPNLVAVFGFNWFASAADLIFALKHVVVWNEEEGGKEAPDQTIALLDRLGGAGETEVELTDELLEQLSPYIEVMGIDWWGRVDELLDGEAGEPFRENFRDDDEDPDGVPPIPPEQRGEFLDYLSEYGN